MWSMVFFFFGHFLSGFCFFELSWSVWSIIEIDYNVIFQGVCCTVCGVLRSPRQTLGVFSGHDVWDNFLGSEAFLLGTCPAG